MTLKLYELSGGIKNLLALMEEEGSGALTWDAALAELQGDFETKAINLAKLYNTWKAEAEIYKAEIVRLQGRMKTAEGKQTWAMDYLKQNMEEAGIDHIKGDVVDIRLQDSPPSVSVEDWHSLLQLGSIHYLTGTVRLPWEQLDALHLTEKAGEPTVDKRAILEEFKATGAVPAGVTIEQGKHVRIR